jgi:hypothetical protein
MTEGPIIQATAVMFLRARHITADGRNHDAEETNIASQRELCRLAAGQIEARIAGEYVEYGGTGPIGARPVVCQMLTGLGTLLGARYVLVTSFDRLARQPDDFTAIAEAIRAAGATSYMLADSPGSTLALPTSPSWASPQSANSTKERRPVWATYDDRSRRVTSLKS